MTKRIFHSICLASILVCLASMVLFMGALYQYFSGLQKKQLRIETELASQGVSALGGQYFQELPAADYRITWIASDGTILFDSKSDTGKMENHLEREEVQQALSSGTGESSRYSETLTKRSLYCAKLLPDRTILRLSAAQYTLPALIFGMAQPISFIVLAAILLSFLLAFRLSRKITNPLNNLDLSNPQKNDVYEELNPLLYHIRSQQRRINRQRQELEQKQNELEKLEQIRREFTANVSHELKTPLHTISGCAELLSEGIVKTEDVEGFSRQIYSQAQRMILLIEDIIRLSHLDEGTGNWKWEDTDLYLLAEETIQALAAEAEDTGISLTLKGEEAFVLGIPQLLKSILHNLCDNAIKYNQKDGCVSVAIKNEEEGVRLTVSDTGIGIPPEHQERIFERFYRVDKSHSKEIGGTGLGLSIVKHAVQLHGGRLHLKSSVGEGTTITVLFPKNQ